MSVGFDFLDEHERDECMEGETAIMAMTFDGNELNKALSSSIV
jgi:hypothetical protein